MNKQNEKETNIYAQAGMVEYAHSRLLSIADGISTVIASLFPAVATIALYFIPSQLVRLGITVAFAAGFAIVLSVFTKARRIEVFSATAA